MRTRIVPRTQYIQASAITNQSISTDASNPTLLQFAQIDESRGLSINPLNNTEIIIDRPGVFTFAPQPQIGKTLGGIVRYYLYSQLDTGSGFEDVPDSTAFEGMQGGVDSATAQTVLITIVHKELKRGWKLRFPCVADNNGVETQFFDSPGDLGLNIPNVPAAILSIVRHGY